MPDTLSDVLARLQYDRGQWETTIGAACWPEPIEVWLPVEEGEPTPYQRRVLGAILRHLTDLQSQLEIPLFEYCREFSGETFMALDAECNFVPYTFPELSEPSQIWSLLDTPVIEIDDRNDADEVEFDLVFSCKWDMEHYLHATFANFQLADVHS